MNERELLQPQTDRLHVFISSRIQELEHLRAHLAAGARESQHRRICYEVALGARPDDQETVSLLQVERTDIFALVIGRSYGEIGSRRTNQGSVSF